MFDLENFLNLRCNLLEYLRPRDENIKNSYASKYKPNSFLVLEKTSCSTCMKNILYKIVLPSFHGQ